MALLQKDLLNFMNGEVLFDDPPGVIVQVELKLRCLVNRALVTLQVLLLMSVTCYISQAL